VPFARSSLNHDDVFVLDTASTIFQFNGVTSSIQERGKALEVVQYIKDTDHDGKCDVIIIGKLLKLERMCKSDYAAISAYQIRRNELEFTYLLDLQVHS
jgi:hypothetical protein